MFFDTPLMPSLVQYRFLVHVNLVPWFMLLAHPICVRLRTLYVSRAASAFSRYAEIHGEQWVPFLKAPTGARPTLVLVKTPRRKCPKLSDLAKVDWRPDRHTDRSR